MAACAHVWEPYSIPPGHGDNGITSSTLQGGKATQAQTQRTPTPGAYCQHCRAWRGTLGNEDTPARYIWHTLLWLREVRRVLRDDGVAWVVLGDGFAGSASHAHEGLAALGAQYRGGGHKQSALDKPAKETHGYAQGCLLGIPQQVMLAAMADNWVVRNDVIWAKASPMPESVAGWRWQQARCACLHTPRVVTGAQGYSTLGHREVSGHTIGGFSNTPSTQPDPDCPTCGGTGRLATEVLRKGSWRHTRATETILMLTKGMGYWANGEAVREAATMTPQRRTNGHSLCTYDPPGRQAPARGDRGVKDQPGIDGPGGRNPRNVLHDAPSATGELAALLLWLMQHQPEVLEAYQTDQREPTNVVTPASSPLGLAHYAAFPPALIEPLIRATCPERCCPTCGMGWAPCISADPYCPPIVPMGVRNVDMSRRDKVRQLDGKSAAWKQHSLSQTLHGLRPSCAHYCTCGPLVPAPDLLVQDRTCPRCAKLPLSAWRPGRCLDPFSGAATTLLVARALGRDAAGVELSPAYVALSRERLGLTALEAWHTGAETRHECFNDLPLFATQETA
jgi:DNA modification methylase